MKFFRKAKPMVNSDTIHPANDQITFQHTGLQSPHILDANGQHGYLAGQFLVATPVINAGPFQKSVIYVFNHSTDGAMGLIINQPIEMIDTAALIEGITMPKNMSAPKLPVYFGGPVERARGFVIHSTDYYRDFSLTRSSELAITASSVI